MNFQSSVVDLTSRLKGSAKVEIAAYSAGSVAAIAASTAAGDAVSWASVGSVEALKIKEAIKKALLTGDNAFEDNFVSDQELKISFNQREAIQEDLRLILRGVLDTVGTPVAGSLVSGYSQVVAAGSWNYNKFIRFTYQNGSKAIITPTSVTLGTDGALTVITDFAIVEQSPGSGIWGIVIEDSTKVTTENQSCTIVYNYTPYASQTIYSGGKTALPYFMLRATNTDENGKLVRFWAYKCQLDDGYDFAFKKDLDADPIVSVPVSITAIGDDTLTAGYKLWKWYQERGIL